MDPREEEIHRRTVAPPEKQAKPRSNDGWRPPLVLVAAGVLLLILAAGGLFLWRSLGDTLSGTSAASDSLDSGPKPNIRLANDRGRISIEGVEDIGGIEYDVVKHAVARDPAEARERASAVSVDVSRDGSEFDISTGGGGDTGAEYALRVPPGASVEVESGAGEVDVAGLSGSVSVVAEAGDVSVRDTSGSINIEAPAGDVEVSDVNTETGQVNLEVGSGDVELTDLVIGTLEASVESGDASLSGRFAGGGRVVVETGSINVSVPNEDARDLTLEARVGTVERNGASNGGDE